MLAVRIFQKTILLLLLAALVRCSEETGLEEPQIADVFLYYKKADGLINNEVTSLFQDSKGNVWVGTATGLSQYDGSTFTNFSYPQIVRGKITAIGEDFNGTIWIGSEYGYSMYDGDAWDTELSISLTTFHLDKSGIFWIGTNLYGLIKFESSGLTTFSNASCDLCNYITDVVEDSNQEIWYTTLGGVGHLIPPNDDVEWLGEADGLPVEAMTAGVLNGWNDLMFGDYGSGQLSRLNNNEFDYLNLPVVDSFVAGMVSDGVGVYLATDHGLLYYDGVVIKEIKTPNEDYPITSVMIDKDGNVWIGTTDSGVVKYTPKTRI